MAKKIKIEEALDLIKDNDYVVVGMAASEPVEFCMNLHTIANRINKITVTNCLAMKPYPFMNEDEYCNKFFLESFFFDGTSRKKFKNGNFSFIPNHLHLASSRRLANKLPDVVVTTVSKPDKFGYVSIGLGNVYEKEHIKNAKTVIFEVNENMPRTFGDVDYKLEDADYYYESDCETPIIPEGAVKEKDLAIGKFIVEHINDGDCIQVGIGGIPDAVVSSLFGKKDLGVHTEMMTTGIMKLAKAGVVTGKFKQTHNGKIVACFAAGTKELYEYMDNNPSIQLLNGEYVNDPHVVGLNDNQVSINTTIEIDLVGQCCSESIGSKQFSGTGGQSDTAVGAKNSKNGKSFIALYSTAFVRNPITGEKEEKSKIVAQLQRGAIVSLSRNDVDYVVTEYGCVCLTGTCVSERVEKLISIAHPDFRDELWRDAIECGLVTKRP